MKILEKFKVIIFLSLGIFIFVWVYDFFAGPESLQLVLNNKEKLILLVLAHIPTLYFDSLAWVILISHKKLSLFWAFIITWVAQTSGKFLPTGNITGEFVRIYLGIKKGLTTTEASSTVFADLVLATFSLFIISAFSLSFILSANMDILYHNYNLYLYFSLFLIFVACLFFYWGVRKRILKFCLRNSFRVFKFSFKKKIILNLLKLDFSLFKLSSQKVTVLKALLARLLGWIGGAFEIYVFLWIIGYDASLMDVILLESFASIIRAIAFFIPAGLGVQELAFVLVGEYVGLTGSIAFSLAIGRRLREVMVGVPAIVAWFFLFNQRRKQ